MTEHNRRTINWSWKEIPIENVFERLYSTLSGIDSCDLEKSIPDLKILLYSTDFWLQVFEGENIRLQNRVVQLEAEQRDNHKQINSLLEFKLKHEQLKEIKYQTDPRAG